MVLQGSQQSWPRRDRTCGYGTERKPVWLDRRDAGERVDREEARRWAAFEGVGQEMGFDSERSKKLQMGDGPKQSLTLSLRTSVFESLALQNRKTDRHTHPKLLFHDIFKSQLFEIGPRLSPHCLKRIPTPPSVGERFQRKAGELEGRQPVRTLGPWSGEHSRGGGPRTQGRGQLPTLPGKAPQGGSRLHEVRRGLLQFQVCIHGDRLTGTLAFSRLCGGNGCDFPRKLAGTTLR